MSKQLISCAIEDHDIDECPVHGIVCLDCGGSHDGCNPKTNPKRCHIHGFDCNKHGKVGAA